MPFGILVGLAAPKAVLVKYTFSRNGTFKLDPRRGKAGTLRVFGSTKYRACASLSEATKGNGPSPPSNFLCRIKTLARMNALGFSAIEVARQRAGR